MQVKKIISVIILVLLANLLCAQSTKVRGKVTDAKTGEPLPLVNISFTGTTIGMTSDFDGLYFLETREDVSELQASFVGYAPQRVKIKPGTYNEVHFQLEPVSYGLEEVVVGLGDNPAHAVLKNIIRNKYRNNPAEMAQYKYSAYTKMELDITNIKPYFKNKKLQKNFGFVFNYMDTSVITGKAFLPVMISETSADCYYRRSPRLNREIINASRISGIKEDYTIAQFTGRMHVDVNFYENYLSIFEVRFASPLSDHGLLYYKYFLVDSLYKDGRKIYKMRFHPKGVSTPVLDGEVNIDSATWALESAKVKMMKGVNVNWIRDLVLETQFQLLNDSVWFMKQDKLFADFTIQMRDSSKLMAFLGHRQIDYSDVEMGAELTDEVLKADNNVVIRKDVLKNDETFWDTLRPNPLSEKERQIYGMVDSVKNTPLYKNIYEFVNTILFGYYNTKYVGFGPYYKLYSFNKLEGNRFQFGAQTTSDLSKKIQLRGYVAYSTKDEKVKGGGGVTYLFNEQPTSMLTVNYKHDVLQLGAGINAFSESNILSSIFSRGNNDRLSPVDQWDINFEKEWRHGVTNIFAAQLRKIYPSPYVQFIRPDGEMESSVNTASLGIKTRLSKDEIIVRNTFEKFSMGSDYPIISLDLSTGIKGILNNDYEYYRAELSWSHYFDIAPLGRSYYVVTGGKIFGKVPYPLLKLHEGNATYFYDPYAYSCMNFYEFASDMWGSIWWEHHFKGFFLGKIPLMKKLKWREVFTFKALWGTLSDKNNGSLPDTKALLLFPAGMSSVSKPYIETGIGIENIFRILRVDAIWRLTHRHDREGQKVQNFAVNFSLYLNF